MDKKEFEEAVIKLRGGCGNKIDINGWCAYYSSQGNLRLCSTCKRKIKKLKEKMYGIPTV